jgi:hypothetical protein
VRPSRRSPGDGGQHAHHPAITWLIAPPTFFPAQSREQTHEQQSNAASRQVFVSFLPSREFNSSKRKCNALQAMARRANINVQSDDACAVQQRECGVKSHAPRNRFRLTTAFALHSGL